MAKRGLAIVFTLLGVAVVLSVGAFIALYLLFGRTPSVETSGRINVQNGRNHNHRGFTYLLAGGGVKGGMAYGATDEFGFRAVENKVHVHDLHATILHLLGLDHEKLTYRYAGRDFRLTDVYGQVVKPILA